MFATIIQMMPTAAIATTRQFKDFFIMVNVLMVNDYSVFANASCLRFFARKYS